MAIIFAMAFIILINASLSMVLKPDNGDQLRMKFNLERYITIFFLIGFLALVAYLSLPAEFMITEVG